MENEEFIHTDPETRSLSIDREAWSGCRYCGSSYCMQGVELTPCASGYLGVEATVGRCNSQDPVGMVIYHRNAAAGYIEFDFCPFCGKPQNDKAWAELKQHLAAVSTSDTGEEGENDGE